MCRRDNRSNRDEGRSIVRCTGFENLEFVGLVDGTANAMGIERMNLADKVGLWYRRNSGN